MRFRYLNRLSYVPEYQFHRAEGEPPPIKETKWISARDAAGGVIRGGTPFQHAKKGGRGNLKGGKRRRKCYCRRVGSDARASAMFYAGCAPERRGR